MNDKSLDELYEYRDKIKEYLRYAELYQGNINLDNNTVTIDQLRDELLSIKAEIAIRLSRRKLKIVK